VSASTNSVDESPSDGINTRARDAQSMKRSKPEGYARSGKGKQKDRPERRNRRGTRNEPAVEGEDIGGPKTPRLPKRQCALLMGFCGSGYSGMQMYAFCNHY
jgi:tRNA pseudouridine38-40 synthase